MDENDIVIIAKVSSDGGSGNSVWYRRNNSTWHELTKDSSGSYVERANPGPPPSEISDNNKTETVSVKVRISNSNNLELSIKAAANIVDGLQKLESALEALPDKTVMFTVGDNVVSGTSLLSHLRSVEFEVVDTIQYNNGGVGGAIKGGGAGGVDKVQFLYSSFDGVNSPDYAHPNYQNNQAIVAIIGHELGHLSAVGDIMTNRSWEFFLEAESNGVETRPYDQTSYWSNNEAYAHDFSDDLTKYIGFDTTGYNPSQGTFWIDPYSIYYNQMYP
jgi:hypothetical protein